jgi:hypothetical protein
MLRIRLNPAEDLEGLLSALDILLKKAEGVFLLPLRELLKCCAIGFNLVVHGRHSNSTASGGPGDVGRASSK